MKLSIVFLCLPLATLSLASIPSAAKNSSLSRKEHRKPSGKKVNGGATNAIGKSSQATKKPVHKGKKMSMKHLKKRVGATKGVKKTSTGAGKKLSAVSGSGKSSQGDGAAQGDCSRFMLSFPKVLVELIGEYLEGFSVVFTRSWSAADSSNRVAVDSERHYLITDQDIQASSHGGGGPVSLGSPTLSRYRNFHSSHDGCSLFFTGKSQEQASRDSSEKTATWLVQDTGTKSLKSVTLESDEILYGSNEFMLSTNGKTMLSTNFSWALSAWTTSVYKIKEHGKAASASKKGDINGHARAVSGDGNRVLISCNEKKQLEIHDVSGDRSNLVLEINYAEAGTIWSYALSNNGSKAAFIDSKRKLYIVDVDKEEGTISVEQLAPIDIPSSVIIHDLICDVKDRLYVFGNCNLWLVEPSKPEFISLEEAQAPQGYITLSSAVSPNGNYIALLFESDNKNEKGEHHYQMIIKGDAKDVLMHLCRYES